MNYVTNPSALATRWQVWLFQLNPRHHIPSAYHINLAEGKGCSKKSLLRYLEYGHSLSNEAFNVLTSTCEREFLPVLQKKHSLSVMPTQKQHLLERFGAKTMFECGWKLPSECIREFFLSNKVDFLEKYLSLIIFSEEDSKTLLSLKNSKLTKAFIECNPYLANTFFSLIAKHDDLDVFKTYFTHCKPLPVGRAEIISKLPTDVFKLMLQHLPREVSKLSFEEFQLLVDRDDIVMLGIYLEYNSIHQSAYIQHICINASDEFFIFCIKKGAFACTSGYEYERLLKLPDRDLVLKYLAEHRIFDAVAEIQVFQSGDEEYIETYCTRIKSRFQKETEIWIWQQGLGEKFGITIADLPPGYWQLETQIFTSGDENLIEQYLFAGEAYSYGLTDFGEAQLFLHAPLNILDAYLEENKPSLLAQKAIISRLKRDSALCGLYLDKHNGEFCAEAAADFLVQTDALLVLKYLKSLENFHNFLCSECPQVLTSLCGRGDVSIYRFLLDERILLGDEDCALFIRHAPINMVMELCKNQDGFDHKAEVEILQHADNELVKYYLKNYTLSKHGETVLIQRFCPELISLYFTGDLANYYVAERYLC